MLNIARVDGFPPHLSVASDDHGAQGVRDASARLIRVHVTPDRVQIVEVPRVGVVADVEEDLVAVRNDLRDVRVCLPDVHDSALVELRFKVVVHLAPLNGAVVVPEGRCHARGEGRAREGQKRVRQGGDGGVRE